MLYQILWSDRPMVHMLPNWTHPVKEEVKIPIVDYTNCESAELFLNGKPLGEQKMSAENQLVWMVPYQKGELKMIAKNNRNEIVQKKFTTAGKANGVHLKIDKKIIANRTAVVHVEVAIVDNNEIMLPDADNLVSCEITGPAKIIGVENGDILDLSPHKVNCRKTFKGKCLLLVKAADQPGTIEIKATSNGLKSGQVKIQSKQ